MRYNQLIINHVSTVSLLFFSRGIIYHLWRVYCNTGNQIITRFFWACQNAESLRVKCYWFEHARPRDYVCEPVTRRSSHLGTRSFPS